MFKPRCEFQLSAIKAVLIAGNVSKFLVGDHLVGDSIKVNLNQGHPLRHQSGAILATLHCKR